MFEGFDEVDIQVPGSVVHARTRGSGPPVLLLHGIPQTHLMWHRLAPRLAERRTVVAADLRGYGSSGVPPSAEDHSPYSMRALADEQVAAMTALGHPRFDVVGHDRGARCAYRMALDHPATVRTLTVLDVVPTAEAFRRADREFAAGFWVWSFLAAPAPVPETLVGAAPEAFVDHMLTSWSDRADVFPADLRDAYVEQFRDADRVHAICEQYRAAATLDVEHDEADRDGPGIACPVPALWSESGPVAAWYDDPIDLWRPWAPDVRGGAVRGGHFLPEEAPEEVGAALTAFLEG